tara:strand:+ start:38 stop:1246 length:1209 start_codon:yes stop_codon:yes gene_type:complete
MVKETHPQIKFTYNPESEMGTVDVEKTEHAEIAPGDTRVQKESLSLRDVLRLSSFLILEKETRAELAKLLGFKSRSEMQAAFGAAGGQRKWMEENPEAVKAAKDRRGSADRADEAERRYKERNPEVAEPEPVAEQPVASKGAPKTVDEWIEYVKAGGSDNLEARIVEVKKSGMNTKEIVAVLNAVPKPKQKSPEDMVYPEGGDHKKFLATLDDKVVLDLVKLKQKIQPGLQIEFEGEKKEGEASDFQGEEGMFVAEIFRTKEGLQVGDIYREGDPTAIVWPTGKRKQERDQKDKQGGTVEAAASPIDITVSELKTAGFSQPSLNELVTKMQELIKVKKISQDAIDVKRLDPAAIAKEAQIDPAAKLLPRDIELVKKALLKLRVVREGTSQKKLLQQLTLLSR